MWEQRLQAELRAARDQRQRDLEAAQHQWQAEAAAIDERQKAELAALREVCHDARSWVQLSVTSSVFVGAALSGACAGARGDAKRA